MTAFATLKPSALSREAFVEAFADIYEHSPWVAERVYGQGISARQQILAAFEERLHNTPAQEFAHSLAEINRIALLRLQAL